MNNDTKPEKLQISTSSNEEKLRLGNGKTNHKEHRLGRIITNVFFVLCLLVLIASIIISVRAKESGQAAEVFGWRPYLIATGSMEPTYSIDGLVITHRDNFLDVKIGDVAAFSAAGLKGRPALHRVIAITCTDKSKINNCPANSRFLWVKGDNNVHPDGAPVTSKNYLGRAKLNTNLTAWWFNAMRQPNGWLQAIVLPLVLLLLIYTGARWLITSPVTWRGKLVAFSLVVFLLSSSILVSYTLYMVKHVNRTNVDLAKIAKQFAKSDTTKTWKVSGQKIIGRIEIPELELDYPIIEYDDSATTLNLTIAQFAGAPLNATGNAVLVGHRAFGDLSPFNLFFTRINLLKKGDKIFVTDPSRARVQYIVQNFGTVEADDNTVLNQPNDKREITMVAASYDFKKRYVVQALAK